MSGVSYQKYLEWERGQVVSESSNQSKSGSEPTVGIVRIPDAPSDQPLSKKNGKRSISRVGKPI